VNITKRPASRNRAEASEKTGRYAKSFVWKRYFLECGDMSPLFQDLGNHVAFKSADMSAHSKTRCQRTFDERRNH
jgi:hypothetical protein